MRNHLTMISVPTPMIRSLQLLQRSPPPTPNTTPNLLISLLSHCTNLKHILQTQSFMISTGLDQDNILLSKFIDTCSSLGHSSYAYSVFLTHEPRNRDIYLYNTVIKALSQTPHFAKDAIFLYNDIQVSGLRPDTYSVPFVLKAVVRLSTIWVGREVHCHAIGTGLDSDVRVVTSIVQMYASCGCVVDARKVFDGFCCRNVAFWNAMVAGYAKVGDLDNARVLFERMTDRNVISWTALIAGYAQTNQANEAIGIFRRMHVEGVEPDEIAMLAALSACADLGALELGEWIHNYIDKHGLPKTVPINNALIDMYAKSGKIKRALEVFENMKHKSIITWTTMIAGLALHGLGREALVMFSRMEGARSKPNEVTFIAILSACSHAGLVEMGRWYFNSMRSRYRIEPQIEHYGCIIDLLGRAGYLQESLELVSEMPFKANKAIWGSILAASKIHGDAELGECALQHLIELEPNNSGNYMLLSNIYASLGRWNEAGMLRKVMKDTCVRKMPGGSFIEDSNKVHEFTAGDISHPQFKTIYEVLCKINEHLKMAGYVQKYCLEDAKF